MKKRNYFTLIVVTLGFAAQAQVSIKAPSNARFVGKDTVARVESPGGFGLLGEAKTDASWDLSEAAYATPSYTFERFEASSTTFSDADYYSEIYYQFSGALKYSLNKYYEVSASQMVSAGEEVAVTQNIPLVSLTGGVNDELVFPAQDIQFSGDEILREYPMEMGDSWKSTIKSSTTFNLTVAALSLNNVPGERRSYRTVSDSVVGWGSMDVKGFYTTKTHTNSVLQIRRHNMIVDSFFLGGNPAPATLLTAFGLSQGQVSETFFVEFVRQGEIEPLVEIAFGENEYTTPEDVAIHQNRLDAQTSAVHNVKDVHALQAYPNPLTSGEVITVSQFGSNEASYQILDLAGRVVQEGAVVNHQVTLNASIPNGTYMLKVADENQSLGMSKLVLDR